MTSAHDALPSAPPALPPRLSLVRDTYRERCCDSDGDYCQINKTSTKIEANWSPPSKETKTHSSNNKLAERCKPKLWPQKTFTQKNCAPKKFYSKKSLVPDNLQPLGPMLCRIYFSGWPGRVGSARIGSGRGRIELTQSSRGLEKFGFFNFFKK